MEKIIVDIGATYIRFGVKFKQPDVVLETPKKYTEILNLIVNEIRKYPTHKESLIGVACPGLVNINKGFIEKALHIDLGDRNLKEDLALMLNNDNIRVINDAKAQTYGYHSLYEKYDFFLLTIGTGIGGAYFGAKDIIGGHNGYFGEVGHIPVINNNAHQCRCGSYECTDSISSGWALEKRFGKDWWKNVEENDYKKELFLAGEYLGRLAVIASQFTDITELIIVSKFLNLAPYKDGILKYWDSYNFLKKPKIVFITDSWVLSSSGINYILK